MAQIASANLELVNYVTLARWVLDRYMAVT